ncbi:hypothetical protein SAMN05421863_111711 [Nitrosomonas communis]|uniref:Uncharacterized protein n=1 Tax=Nitrosomonas communis TaxID=44574 RepID=A0A1I4WSB7_9PROT|nr:hypothetical protein SAMN05421863_111711 [Nitrosomonas communis]
MPELNVPEGKIANGLFNVRSLWGSNPGCESVQRIMLGCGVKPPKI